MKNYIIFGLAVLALVLFFGCTEKQPDEVMCTMDAMLCPDGSYVGRIAPDCNFAPCPAIVGGDKDEHDCIGSAGYSWCEEKQKCLRIWEEPCEAVACTMEYMPVCAEVQIQCITTPCDPIRQTFGNRCAAEAQGAIVLYEGECVDLEGTQIANPASTYCIDNNGTLEITDSPEGQVGMCTLPNGTVCEEWSYFRGDCE